MTRPLPKLRDRIPGWLVVSLSVMRPRVFTSGEMFFSDWNGYSFGRVPTSEPITADVRIALTTGPEVLAGSTRLKAGTATKLALNMLTLGSMVQIGKTYGNWMIDVRPSSRKLQARAERLVQTLGKLSPVQSSQMLASADGQVKLAVLMARKRLSKTEAAAQLLQAGGSLHRALLETRMHG